MDNPDPTGKNSPLRARNTEQSQTSKIDHILFHLMNFMGAIIILFGITISKGLRQFPDRIGITHRSCVVSTFYSPKSIINTVSNRKVEYIRGIYYGLDEPRD
jgi:hypothetical protein